MRPASSPIAIATSRYQERDLILESGLAPVRTTVGRPRFQLGYELAGSCSMLAPHGLFGKKLTDEEFANRYRARLEGFGVDAIREKLVELAGDRPGVVLLCFENVHARELCHRTTFAAWWREQTGEDVFEL